MTKDEKIIEKLRESFDTKDFFKWGPADGFHCDCEKQEDGMCGVNKKDQPILSPFFGSGECKVMVVAEKPSGTGGTGPKIGGLFADLDEEKVGRNNPILSFRDFATGYCNKATPYMTDLAKCGYRGTEPSADELRTRFNNCFKRFLKMEIEVMAPDRILCVGRVAYDYLVASQEHGDIDSKIKLIWLIHYSRQAQLHLSPEEKVELWRWQASRGSEKKLEEMRLSELEYIKEIKRSWEG